MPCHAACRVTQPADIVAGLLPPPLAVLGAHVAQQADAPSARQALGSTCLVAVRGEAGALECCLGGTPGAVQAAVLTSSGSTASSSGSIAGPLGERYLPLRCSAPLVLQLREPPAVGGGMMAPGPQALAAAFEELRRRACGPGTVYLIEPAGGQAGTGEAGAHAVMALPGRCIGSRAWGHEDTALLARHAFCSFGLSVCIQDCKAAPAPPACRRAAAGSHGHLLVPPALSAALLQRGKRGGSVRSAVRELRAGQGRRGVRGVARGRAVLCSPGDAGTRCCGSGVGCRQAGRSMWRAV